MFEDVVEALSRVDRDVSDAARVDQLTALERVKAVCAALQARITVDFAESQEDVAAGAGQGMRRRVRLRRVGRGAGASTPCLR